MEEKKKTKKTGTTYTHKMCKTCLCITHCVSSSSLSPGFLKRNLCCRMREIERIEYGIDHRKTEGESTVDFRPVDVEVGVWEK